MIFASADDLMFLALSSLIYSTSPLPIRSAAVEVSSGAASHSRLSDGPQHLRE